MFFDRKGQLEIGVTTMIVLVFIILLMFSLVIYFRFTYNELKQTKENLMDQRYSGLLSSIIGLPEFRCSKLGIEEECLDAAKLEIIKEVINENKENKDYYDNVFGNANGIWVEIITPKTLDANKGDSVYPNEKYFEIYGKKDSSGLIYSAPVSVYYPDYKQYQIGILKIQGDL